MKFVMTLQITLLILTTSFSQDKYVLSSERIVLKGNGLIDLQKGRSYYPAGKNGTLLVYQMNRKATTSYGGRSSEGVLKVYYDEMTKTITDSTDLQKKSQKIHRFTQNNDVTIFHGFFTVSPEHENKLIDELNRGEVFLNYQDIWAEKSGKKTKLISFPEHYSDKDVEYSIDSSGKYVLINTFVSTYLRSTNADSIINIFDLSLAKEHENDRSIYCVECINPQIIGNYIYYGKKFFYLRGADVYDWKIYRAPIFDLAKSELIGEYIELIFVSPDGRYILGKKSLYGKEAFVILDVASKKFQFLLGRGYTKYKFFYSPAFQQFAFDFEDHIIYIEYPKQFPFNSIGKDVEPKQTSNSEDKLFWSKFMHTP